MVVHQRPKKANLERDPKVSGLGEVIFYGFLFVCLFCCHLLFSYLVPSSVLRVLHMTISVIIIWLSQHHKNCCHSRFTNEETKAQRNKQLSQGQTTTKFQTQDSFSGTLIPGILNYILCILNYRNGFLLVDWWKKSMSYWGAFEVLRGILWKMFFMKHTFTRNQCSHALPHHGHGPKQQPPPSLNFFWNHILFSIQTLHSTL